MDQRRTEEPGYGSRQKLNRIPFPAPSSEGQMDQIRRGQYLLDGSPNESKASGDEIRSVKTRRCRIGRSAETADSLAPGRIKAKKRKRWKSRAPRDCYGVTSYRRAIHRACDLTEIERWTPNRLRHTAATRARREMGIDAARALLGHSDADTPTIHAQRDQELARTAMERLG